MKIKTLLFSSLMLLLAACSKDSVQVTCLNVDGYQSKAVKVTEDPITLEVSGEGDVQTLTMTVPMTANEHISGITDLSDENIKLDDDFCVQLSASGSTKLKLDSDSSKTAFINLLKGKKGAEANIKFSAKVAKDKLKEILKDLDHFTVRDLNVDLTNITLSGNIGTYPVCMTLNVASNGVITGAYYYAKKGPGAYLYLKSTSNWASTSTIPEFNDRAENTGVFEGKFENDIFNGKFTTNGNTYVYSLKTDKTLSPIDLSTVPFDSFEMPVQSSSSSAYESDSSSDESSSFDDGDFEEGSVDIDELLDTYERLIDKGHSMMKKIENNDPTAIVEYQQYVAELMDYADKFRKIKGNFSESQLKRFNRLLTKAAEMYKK